MHDCSDGDTALTETTVVAVLGTLVVFGATAVGVVVSSRFLLGEPLRTTVESAVVAGTIAAVTLLCTRYL